MKKFGKYLLITLLLLLGLCCIGVLYLFFVPGSSLFGITFISMDETYGSIVYSEAQYSSVHTVKVNSRDFDVQLAPTENISKISLQVYANSFGFVMQKNSAVQITSRIENGTLTFNVTEPHGFALRNRSKVTLIIPTELNKHLSLNNRNAATTISGKDLKINDLYYSTTSGKLNINNVSISGSLNLDLNSAVAKLGAGVSLNNANVNLTMHNGKFDGANYDFGTINIKSNDYGSVLAKSCQKLTSDNAESGGRVEIGTLGDINLIGGDTNVYVNELTKCTRLDLKKSGKVEIKNVVGASNITTANGSIKINKANDSLILKSTNGNINVLAAYSSVTADSSYGDISITYAHDDDSKTDLRSLNSEIGNGKLVVYGVEHVNIEMTGRARAEIYMDNVKGANNIKVGSGSVYVEVKEIDKATNPNGNAKYTLTTWSTGGSVDVNIDNAVYTSNNTTPNTINPQNPSEENNSLTVYSESAGSIKLRNTYSKYY